MLPGKKRFNISGPNTFVAETSSVSIVLIFSSQKTAGTCISTSITTSNISWQNFSSHKIGKIRSNIRRSTPMYRDVQQNLQIRQTSKRIVDKIHFFDVESFYRQPTENIYAFTKQFTLALYLLESRSSINETSDLENPLFSSSSIVDFRPEKNFRDIL
jgi:hypothetical protein